MSSTPDRPSLLLVEPQFVLRRTIVAVAHDLGIARFQEVTGCDAAAPLLGSKRFDGMVLDGSNAEAACGLLSRLRDGAFAPDPNIPVIVMAPDPVDAAFEERLRPLESTRLLRKPFKVGELFQQIERQFAEGWRGRRRETVPMQDAYAAVGAQPGRTCTT